MGFRVILVAVMGLGAMYMMHLLAQDWNRIRPIQGITNLAGQATSQLQGIATQAGSGLQSIASLAGRASASAFNRGKRSTRQELYARGLRPHPTVDWKRILSRDPFECLQSLICQLMSGAEQSSPEAELLMDFLESSVEMAPAKIGRAFSRGLALRGSTESCYNEYPFCLYSAKTMLRILRWFSESEIKVLPDDEE
ncbi:uncharacterized protein Dwil_GK24745 [Drosophila willistoni]|uniref:Uncharacterized protein n=1 Tax=Drosophila willistoni TaxID=7260 RepID=B4MZZ1_DROWI|nr:uncharacterized protein LOC6643877 [Drosophila willistoni]EDW77926.2 uncharacterized protein Dwil_GK24745 [Drosophila willistoni]